MAGSADANLLVASVYADDALHTRATAHLQRVDRLRATVPAVLEAFIAVRRKGGSQQALIADLAKRFDIEQQAVLETAARALDEGLIGTPFDAYHAAEALLRGERLHTADKELLASEFPTIRY